ncbi:MAG: hypothetical protein AAGC93_11960 [Cyanobacteria bacterium P01_F01_bin.53]
MDRPDISKLLTAETNWVSPALYLYEGDDCLRLTLAGAIQYSGLGSVGGVVLGFRLVQYAVELAAGTSRLQRDGISINTAFPGRGTRDTFEYTCRAIRDHRYCCDTTLHHPGAQVGQRGQFLFVMRVNEQSMVMTPTYGYPTYSYFEAARKSRESEAAALNWRNEKIGFANTLLSLPPEKCIKVL